ncbi:hypothetical protein [Paraferrimonas haliotis]|uniref:Phage shock protein B n=1 Tax=Paraferrimonas haliotis TaxID=2013866 RepID=A0AA37WXC3_9GAMM|nr:hypothetical protein [Paraferrimonas haliotis]GLS84227.1 hypothetical protein GCM10007894_22040 [Paraferrimonas haliotis]
MSPATLALLIPIIAIAGGILLKAYRTHIAHKQELMQHEIEIKGKASQQKVANLEEQVAQLTQRVVTLEALVTDSRYQLQKDIDAL